MFDVDRIYSVRSEKSGLTEWYFMVREGRRGPYSSITNARIALDQYILNCIKNGITNRQLPQRLVNRITHSAGTNRLVKPSSQTKHTDDLLKRPLVNSRMVYDFI